MPEPAVTAALLSITASTGGTILWEAHRARRLGERNNKLLEGIEDSDAYDGLVEKVERHEDALRRAGVLDAQEE